MSISTVTNTNWNGPQLAARTCPGEKQTDRIRTALGLASGDLPNVDEDTLARYYTYLEANLSFPFVAYYPEPRNAREKAEFRCTVVELLAPTKHLGDEIDGIFCKIRKGSFEVNLPVIELHLPDDSPNSQLIEDYWFWFWNWQ
jgi:hypothetical protein